VATGLRSLTAVGPRRRGSASMTTTRPLHCTAGSASVTLGAACVTRTVGDRRPVHARVAHGDLDAYGCQAVDARCCSPSVTSTTVSSNPSRRYRTPVASSRIRTSGSARPDTATARRTSRPRWTTHGRRRRRDRDGCLRPGPGRCRTCIGTARDAGVQSAGQSRTGQHGPGGARTGRLGRRENRRPDHSGSQRQPDGHAATPANRCRAGHSERLVVDSRRLETLAVPPSAKLESTCNGEG
jgi:hypothetical protein